MVKANGEKKLDQENMKLSKKIKDQGREKSFKGNRKQKGENVWIFLA